MYIKPEREVYRTEDGVFMYDIWQVGEGYEISCFRADSANQFRTFTYGETRQQAISKAVEECKGKE
ncbi:hypothetical protein [Halobacillus sp. Marseille-P3879]|uniref:hypothetical protein n=1 Tax=Halobacillus sp. Marseille-P3879 TaxID=2045014 RepID=UPI000C7D6217|nr:hypothetical protein [Halobacillus sp. Marseille-P3879]